MEMQIMHQADDNSLVGVVVSYVIAFQDNPILEKILATMSSPNVGPVPIDALLPTSHAYYVYRRMTTSTRPAMFAKVSGLGNAPCPSACLTTRARQRRENFGLLGRGKRCL